ncbi:hypothetical protein K438DRAFT_1778406 [Mycena galopus ATCC 62051]|nr:hypothetical protein K438DRAFT_1778406 [Mycena galopus ATCC 62051]
MLQGSFKPLSHQLTQYGLSALLFAPGVYLIYENVFVSSGREPARPGICLKASQASRNLPRLETHCCQGKTNRRGSQSTVVAVGNPCQGRRGCDSYYTRMGNETSKPGSASKRSGMVKSNVVVGHKFEIFRKPAHGTTGKGAETGGNHEFIHRYKNEQTNKSEALFHNCEIGFKYSGEAECYLQLFKE